MKYLLPLMAILFSCSTEKPKWNYRDINQWGDVSVLCNEGKLQSPILIGTVKKEKYKNDLTFNYTPTKFTKKYKKGTFNIDPHVEGKNTYAVYKGKRFDFKNIHFHVPSSHSIKGLFYMAEVHLVHIAKDGEKLVVGALYRLGGDSKRINSALKNETVDPKRFLPEDINSSYRYTGSLTTPPCTEGVNFVILKSPKTIGREQVEKLMNPKGGFNNRPPQPANGRVIIETY